MILMWMMILMCWLLVLLSDFRQAVGCVGKHVEFVRKRQVIVELHHAHRVEVGVKTLQVQHQHRRQRLDAAALDCGHFFGAAVHPDFIVCVESLAFDVEV